MSSPATREQVLVQALQPMHKRAFGISVGITAAFFVLLVTVYHILVRPEGLPLELLAAYFYGYDVSWRGAFIGAWWAFVAGFVGGWFTAFLRNLVVALWIMRIRMRADLDETRDFLDRI